MCSIPFSTFIEQKWHGCQLLWHHFQKVKFMFSIPVRTCFKNCCYHFIVVSMEWCIYKVQCIDIAFYLQIKWDGSSEGSACYICMRSFLHWVCGPNSHLHNYYIPECWYIYIYIYCSIEWHGAQVVRRWSRKPKTMGSNPILAFIEKSSNFMEMYINWRTL